MVLLRNKSKRDEVRQALYEKLDSTGLDIATAVKTLRKILAKSQEDFAVMTGVSLATLRKIEQNRGNVTIGSLEKILRLFSLTLVVKTKGRVPAV